MINGVTIAPSEAPLCEDAVAQRTLVARQQPLRGRQRAGPLPGLEETQHDPAKKQLGVIVHPPGHEPDCRPAQQDRGVKPAQADPVGNGTRDQTADGERQSKTRLEPAIALVTELEFLADVGRLLGQGLTIHVVEHGRQQHEPADGPGPKRRLAVFRHGHVRPRVGAHLSHPTTARPRRPPGRGTWRHRRQRGGRGSRPSRRWPGGGRRCARGCCVPG